MIQRVSVSDVWNEVKAVGNAGLKMVVFSTHLVFVLIGAYFFGLVLHSGDQLVLTPKCEVSPQKGAVHDKKMGR